MLKKLYAKVYQVKWLEFYHEFFTSVNVKVLNSLDNDLKNRIISNLELYYSPSLSFSTLILLTTLLTQLVRLTICAAANNGTLQNVHASYPATTMNLRTVYNDLQNSNNYLHD